MGSSSGESLLLQLLVFWVRFLVQCGCTMEYQFFLVLLLQKWKCDKGECNHMREMSLPQHSLGISSKGCSQKHQQETSWCWLHVTTSPSWDRAVTQHKTPWQLIIHYQVLVGLQPCMLFFFFFFLHGFILGLQEPMFPSNQISVSRCSGSAWTSKDGRLEETQSESLWQTEYILMLKRE